MAEHAPLRIWSGGFFYGFFFKKGLYDSSGLNTFIADWFVDREPTQHFSIGVANVLTGFFDSYDE